jgi:hypothetical protein
MTTTSAIVAVIGAGVSYKQGQDQKKAAKKEFEQQQKLAEVENLRNVRASIRAARTAAGRVTNFAGQTGTMQSSGMAGGLASIGSQLDANIGYTRDTAAISNTISRIQLNNAQSQANYAVLGSTLGAIGGVADSIFEAQGGWKKYFGGTQTTPYNYSQGSMTRDPNYGYVTGRNFNG